MLYSATKMPLETVVLKRKTSNAIPRPLGGELVRQPRPQSRVYISSSSLGKGI